MAKNPVTMAIKEFISKTSEECGYKVSPRYEINRGECEMLADYVEENVEDAESIRLIELLCPGLDDDGQEDYEDEHEEIIHYVVRYKGRYYDAEVPGGVDSIEKIPVVKRFRKKIKKGEQCIKNKDDV